jgi:RHS repeat-associated protein
VALDTDSASYDWDLVGNLARRGDTAANAVNGGSEYFCHDVLNRVTHASATALNCASPGGAQFSYSPLGNLTKSGITTTYQANGNKLLTLNGQTVQYDAGGNITSDGSRIYTYNAFDIPDSITQTVNSAINPGTYKSMWGFGPDKQRTYEISTKATTTGGSTFNALNMTWFAGPGHFELDETIDTASGSWRITEMRHFISSPEGNIGVVAIMASTDAANPADIRTERYFLKDHLGSNAGTFKQNALESRATYDVWGVRVESGNPVLSGFDTSQRGYTGHEHLATFGLIHMNGRIYDPLLGRFLQADPIIDEPFNLQSYNRYAYVGNNPLAFTDPTGYSKWTNFRDRYGKTVLAMAAGFIVPQLAFIQGWATSMSAATGGLISTSAFAGAAGGFAAGGIQGGNLNSALQGAFTGGLFGAAGTFGAENSLTRLAAHAVAGCASSAARGGECGAGAAGAVVGKLFTNMTHDLTPPLQFAGAVVGGGLGAKAAGGSFDDGAINAAMGYAMNNCFSQGLCRRAVDDMVRSIQQGVGSMRDRVSSFVAPAVNFVKSMGNQAEDGANTQYGGGAMLAAGVGVKTETTVALDTKGNSCFVSTVCGVAGPIAIVSTTANLSVSTGTLTPGSSTWQFGFVGGAGSGLGVLGDVMVGADGSAQLGRSAGFAVGAGVGVQACRQSVASKC